MVDAPQHDTRRWAVLQEMDGMLVLCHEVSPFTCRFQELQAWVRRGGRFKTIAPALLIINTEWIVRLGDSQWAWCGGYAAPVLWLGDLAGAQLVLAEHFM